MDQVDQTNVVLNVYKPAFRWQLYTWAVNILLIGFALLMPLAAFTTPNPAVIHTFTLACSLLALGLLVLYNYYYGTWGGRVRLITFEHGIFYQGPGYKMYVPWSDLLTPSSAVYGTYTVDGIDVRPLSEETKAQIERDFPQLATSYSSWLRGGARLLPFLDFFTLLPAPRLHHYARAIPVGVFAEGSWQESTLGDEIRLYAPQVLEEAA